MAIRSDGTKALAALLAGAALAGCGSQEIDRGKAETFVRQSFGPPSAQTVTCPSGVKATKGHTFTCSVTDVSGRRYTVTLHILDGAKVRVGPQDVRPVGSGD